MSKFDWQSVNENFQGQKKLEDGRILIPRINLEDIEVDPLQPRKKASESNVESLADTIEEVGVIHPILCVRTEGGKYRIVSGERRYWALKKTGRKQTDIILLENPEKGRMIQLIENLSRQDLSPLEESQAIDSLLREYKFKQKDLAKKLGKSSPFITRSLNVLKIIPVVLESMESSSQRISQEVYWMMGELDPKDQEKVWKKIETNPTIGALKKAKEQLEGPSPAEKKSKKKKTAKTSLAYRPQKSKWIKEIAFHKAPTTPKEIDEIIQELLSLKSKLKKDLKQ